MKIRKVVAFVVVLFSFQITSLEAQTITEIIDATDDRITYAVDGQVEVSDSIQIIALINPEDEHVGEVAGILVAVLDTANPDIIFLMNSEGQFTIFDVQTFTLSDEITLAVNNIVDITRGTPITLTSSDVGIYHLFVGYQLLSGGVIYFNGDPIVVDVLE